MNKGQLLATFRKSERHRLLLAFGLFVGFWLIMFEVAPAVLRNMPEATAPTRLIVFDAGVVLLVAGFIAISQRMRVRVNCPRCKKRIEGRELLDLGYTEKCSSCGAKVFSGASIEVGAKPDELRPICAAAPKPRADKAEFFAAIQACRREVANRSWRIGVIAVAPGMIAFAVVLMVGQELRGAFRVIAGVLGVGGLLAALSYSLLANRQAARRHRLVCPACGICFTTVQLWDLGYLERCAGCGVRIFE